MSKPFAWSYSSLTAFENCPWRWKLTKLTKQVTEPQTVATLEGNKVHKMLEKALVERAPLQVGYEWLNPVVARLQTAGGLVEAERKIALTPQFTETTYFGKDVWFRTAFDVRVTLPKLTVILDWKTGKRKLDADQLRLSAAVEFKVRPSVEAVQTGYAWLQDKKIDRETYTRDQAPEIWQEFMQRVGRIEHAIKTDNFPKKPSGLCRKWCPVGRRLCEHCGEE
jgi:hypothetical protein